MDAKVKKTFHLYKNNAYISLRMCIISHLDVCTQRCSSYDKETRSGEKKKKKKKKRGDGYLLNNLTKDISHCKKEWLHSPASFHPFPWGTLPLSHAGLNSHPPGYATLVKYLGTTAGRVGKITRGGKRERERSCWGGGGYGVSLNLRCGEADRLKRRSLLNKTCY